MAKDSLSDYVPYDQQPGVKKKNNLIIIFTGVLVLFLVILGSSSANKEGNPKESITKASPTPASSVETTGSNECTTIRTDITMLRTSFSVGEDSPQEVGFLLEAARNDFSRSASSFTGSKAAWLDKMAELITKVHSYIVSGSPADGPKALDQLFANMNLVDQFCE